MKLRLTLWSFFVAASLAAMGCAGIPSHNLPPAERLMAPGPGVDGPGPGVLMPALPPALPMAGGVMEQQTVQLLFDRPEGMQIRWDVSGVGQFDSDPLILPGRKNFPSGGIYRLKITNVAGREGVELYPTLEVAHATPRTAAYLAHNAVPIQFTEEDFDQVLSGNFVTKVIYLPDPEFQEMALAGVETLVSTRLDPGTDPIVEADRRGSIMAVVRLGNKDIEMPGSNGDSVVAANYQAGLCPLPMAGSPAGLPGAVPPYVSGVSVPQWGMASSGTPIGLPGPPHIPLGAPAGLQKYVIRNHTPMHIPGPTERFTVDVRQSPGYSYPRPAAHVSLREQSIHPALPYHQPLGDHIEVVR
mgnify:CR=1 FL=1